MDKSSANAYIYAKASGMLAKSFISDRTQRLFEPKNLSQLWTLLFKTEIPLVPEVLLARQIERKAEENFINDYITLISSYSNPDRVLILLLQQFDYMNLKEVLSSTAEKNPQTPYMINIEPYNLLNYSEWADLSHFTQDSTLSWCTKSPESKEKKNIEHKLDSQYVKELWASIDDVNSLEREPVRALIKEELILKNILWALRLKVYYQMSKESIIPLLTYISDDMNLNDEIAKPAIELLDYPIDSYDVWKKWKYSFLLNPSEEGCVWELDPRWLENSSKTYLNKLALKQYHKYPFTSHVMVCWFRIKFHELNCIRTACEGLKLNVNEQDIKKMVNLGNQA